MAPKNKVTTKKEEAKPQTKQVNAPPKATPGPEVETTAIAQHVAAPVALSGNAPAWLQKRMDAEGPRGLDKMDDSDLILPRLVLAQALSPEVANGADLGLDIKVGDIFDNLSKTVICRAGEELEIIPIILGKSRMHLQPFADGGGILCRADDARTARPGGDGVDQGNVPTRDCDKCIHKEWDEENGKPACSLFYNIIVLLPSRGYAAFVWSCKHTNVKVVKRFLSTAKQTGADFFARKYSLGTVTEKNDQFTYKNFTFRAVDWVTEEEYERALAFYKSLEGKTWTPSTEDIEREVAAPTSAQGPEDAEIVEGTAMQREPGSDDDDIEF